MFHISNILYLCILLCHCILILFFSIFFFKLKKQYYIIQPIHIVDSLLYFANTKIFANVQKFESTKCEFQELDYKCINNLIIISNFPLYKFIYNNNNKSKL